MKREASGCGSKPRRRGPFPDVTLEHVRVSCAHCANAECIKECPTGATFRAEDGFVLITQERCIGCGTCVDACPYGARYMRQVGQMLKADKCAWCYARVYEGQKPVCVEKCITGALLFGLSSDPAIKAALEEPGVDVYHPEYNTKPQLYRKSPRPRHNDVKVLAPNAAPSSMKHRAWAGEGHGRTCPKAAANTSTG